MLRRQFRKIVFGLRILALALLFLLVLIPSVWAQSGGQGPNAMNFQGRLLDSSGNPLDNATRCLRFRLCSDSGCTTQVWPASGYEYHAVTTGSGSYKTGLFTTTLGDASPLSPDVFQDHDTLYLEIGVSDSGSSCASATYATLSPTSPLHASAFAQRSRRVHDIESDADYLIDVQNNGAGGAIYSKISSTTDGASAGEFYAVGSSGRTYAVYAENSSAGAYAAAGHFYALGTSGQTYGIDVENKSTATFATAGHFKASGASGQTYGISVENQSASGGATAGRFQATGTSGATLGIDVENKSTTNDASAGRFKASGTGGRTYGIVAENASTGGGAAAGTFTALGASGQTYGINVENQSTTNLAMAGYFLASGSSGKTYGISAENWSTTDEAAAGRFQVIGTSGQTYGIDVNNKSTTNKAAAGRFQATGTSGATFGIDVENKSGSANAAAGRFLSTSSTGVTTAVSAENYSESDNAIAGYFRMTGSSGQTYGIYGVNESETDEAAAGVFIADGTSGKTYGVYASNLSTTDHAAAGHFQAEGTSGATYAVYAETKSTGGVGVYGKSPHIGVDGQGKTGVRGWTSEGDGSGVYGRHSASSGSGSGVYGRTDSPNGRALYGLATAGGYGLYSEGNARVDGQLTWSAITSYIALAPAAFRPTSDGYSFWNLGSALSPENETSYDYFAAVQLPHGSTVTKFTFYWVDEISYDGYAELIRADPTAAISGEDVMATAYTSGISSWPSSSVDTTIDYATVDNSRYVYFAKVHLPHDQVNANAVSLLGVIIEYTIDRPY